MFSPESEPKLTGNALLPPRLELVEVVSSRHCFRGLGKLFKLNFPDYRILEAILVQLFVFSEIL